MRHNGLDRVFYRRERGPGPSVTAGVPFLCHAIIVTELKKCHATKNKMEARTVTGGPEKLNQWFSGYHVRKVGSTLNKPDV